MASDNEAGLKSLTDDEMFDRKPLTDEEMAEGSFQLSPNFHKKEFNQSRRPLDLESFEVNPTLVDKLEELRTAIGNKPIRVTSGYRSSEYNKEVGGVSKSQHLTGSAADITVKGMTSTELKKVADKVGFGYTETYKNKPHLHLDVRGLSKKAK